MIRNIFLTTLILGGLPMPMVLAQNVSFFNRTFPLATSSGSYLGSPACIIQTTWSSTYNLDKLCQSNNSQNNTESGQMSPPIQAPSSPQPSSNLPTSNNSLPNSSPPPSADSSPTSKPPNNSPSSPAVLVQPTTQPSIYQRFTGVQTNP